MFRQIGYLAMQCALMLRKRTLEGLRFLRGILSSFRQKNSKNFNCQLNHLYKLDEISD